jgi:chemotaxis-related protein WspB
MLFALFRMGDSTYAVDAAQIVEVLPLLDVTTVPGAPRGIAGVCNYRGEPVPVMDLSALVTGEPAPRLVSTRMFLTRHTATHGPSRLLALIVAGATDTVRLDPSSFTAAGLSVDGREWLGPIAPHRNGLLRKIDISALLPATSRA